LADLGFTAFVADLFGAGVRLGRLSCHSKLSGHFLWIAISNP
jgi:hypothetical protein